MSEKKLYLARLSLLYTDIAFFAAVLPVFFRRHAHLEAPPFLLWAAVTAAGLLVNTLIRRRGGTLNATVFFTAALGAFMGAALVLRISEGKYSFWMTVTGFLLGAGPVIHGSVLAHENWNHHRQALFLDGLTAEVVFLLLAYCAGSFPGIRPYLIWTFCALALSALMLTACRMPDGGPASFVPACLFAALCLFACIAGRAFIPLSAGIVSIVRYVSAADAGLARAAGSLVLGFLNRLLALLPLPQEEIVLQEAQQPGMELPVSFSDAQIPGMQGMVLVTVCLAVLACFWIRRRLKGRRWQMPSAAMTQDPAARREKKRGWLRAHLAAFAGRLAFLFRYLMNRNTPEGLLTFTEKKMAGTEHRRRRGKSAPGFLRRVSERLDEGGARCANDLADELEKMYYNNKPGNLPDGFAGMYRRSLRTGRT